MAIAPSHNETETVTLTIDGHEVTVPKGTNLIEAAKAIGKYVPHYCYHPSLSIDGNCRLCLLEVEKMPKLTIGCNTMAMDGMVVHTNSEQVQDAQKGMMEFLLVNHPLDCPVCDRGGECQLQRFSMDYGVGDSRMIDERRKFPKEKFDELIDLERNRCIVCTRCVRFMDQIGGEHLLGVFNRGNGDHIGTYDNQPISTNAFSGNVIDICPVGALTSRPYRFRARNWELQQVQGTCTLCPSGCRVTYWTRDGKIFRTTPPTRPDNKKYVIDNDTMEFICNAGRFGNDFVNTPDRLKMPIVDGELSMWGTAIDTTIERLNGVIESDGANAVGFLVSPRSSIEEMYQVNRLARGVVGTNNIDWRGGLLDPNTAKAWSVAYDNADGQIEDLTDYDTILVLNADVGSEAPVAALKIKESARFGYSTVISAGYRQDEWFATHINASINVAPQNAPLFLRQLADTIEREGDPDDGAVNAMAKLIGADGDSARSLLDQVNGAQNLLVVYGLADNGGLAAPALVTEALRLRDVAGGKAKLLPFVSERNARGAFAMGCQPDRLPGGPVDDLTVSGKLDEFWGNLPTDKGMTAPEMIHAAADGSLKAMVIFGVHALDRFPDIDLLERALDKLDLLIVHDNLPSWISARAHIVLPGNIFTEGFGSYADLGGAVVRGGLGRRPLKRTQIQQHVATLGEMMQGLGANNVLLNGHDVFDRILEVVSVSDTIDYDQLTPSGPGETAPIWVKTDPEMDRPVLGGSKPFSMFSTYKPTFTLTNTNTRRASDTSFEQNDFAPSKGGLTLTWSRELMAGDMALNHSEALNAIKQESPEKIAAEFHIEIHPQTAQDAGVATGDTIKVTEPGGAEGLVGTVKVTPHVAPGVVFVPQNAYPFELPASTRRLPTVAIQKTDGAHA